MQSFLKKSLLLTLGMMMLNYESGRTAEINALHKYIKVNVDYSKDIIGLWEGVEMTGYETYGNAEARIKYEADGTYTYYRKVDGEWQALVEDLAEWNVDGDWLAGTRFNTTFTWKKITL